MPETLNYKLNNDRIQILCFWILICAVYVLMYISGLAPIKKYELADPDCYMRLVRASDLYNSGQWYDPVIQRSNAPYGERLHWTRPFDILLILGAVPISLFTDFESALFWWGVIISPILIIATLVALQWSTRPILNKDGPFLAGFVFVCQMTIFTCFQAGRPDHHSLLIFLFVILIGLTLRMVLRPFNIILCYTAGAISALSIWVSVESLLPICVIIAVLGFLWILVNGDFANKCLHYSLALFIFTSFSIILERPWYDLATQELDRLSIVHWSLLGSLGLFWITISIFDRYTNCVQRAAYRIYFFLAGAVTIALIIWLFFPKFYNGPIADIDPRIIPLWLKKVREVQPILSISYVVYPLQLLGLAVICYPFLCYLILREKGNNNWKGWIFIALAPVVFVFISFYQMRWSVYAQILLIIPMTELMVLLRQRGPKTGLLKIVKNLFIVMIFSSGFLLFGLLVDEVFKKGDSEKKYNTVSLIRICDFLTDAEKWQQRSFRILTHIDYGAEILYRTQHEVIGTPYHRNSQGILDTYEIMTADTDHAALSLVRKRSIDVIMLCPKSTESIFYSKPEKKSTFYQRLCDGMIPNWLRKVDLPSDLSSSLLLFETVETSNSDILMPGDPISNL